jgi:RNA polymerase sigma-70 factor, ECF subfamily
VEARRIDDAEFLGHLRAGRRQRAAAWLVEQHAHEVLALCRAMVRDAAAAEDLAQETFGRAFAALGEFRGDASTRTWLLTIARHGCIDHLRARRRSPWGAEGAEPADPDEVADDAPLPPELLGSRREVASALDELTEGERALVVLRFAHGFEYGELAATFGLREGTVRMRLSRALARMRARLAPPPLACEAAAAPAPRAAPVPAAPRAAAPRRRVAAAVAPSSFSVAGLARRAFGGGGGPAAGGTGAPDFGSVLQALGGGVSATLRDRLLATASAL